MAVAVGVAALIGAGTSVYSAVEAKSDAKKQRRAQEEQQRLQQRVAEARARRDMRIRQAKMNLSAGAQGVTSSATTGARIGGTTAYESQVDMIKDAGSLQREQFAIQESMTSSQANAAIGQAIGSFTSTMFSPTGSNNEGPSLWDTIRGE